MEIEKEQLEKIKIGIEVIAIIFAGLFAIWKWGFEAYWSREDNYRAYFKDMSQQDEPAFYLTANEMESGDYIRITGEVIVSNFSTAPIHIENTTLYFINYSQNECDPLSDDLSTTASNPCMKSNNTTSIFQQVCTRDPSSCDTGFKTTLFPIDNLPLFGKKDANRPFDISLPSSLFIDGNNQHGLFVIAEQEIGKACIKGGLFRKMFNTVLFQKCYISRALTVFNDLP